MSCRKRQGGIFGFLLPIVVIALVIGGVVMIDPSVRSELFNRVLAQLPILKNLAVVNTTTGYFGVNVENRDFLITKVYDVDYLLSLEKGDQHYIAIYPFTVEAGLKFDGKDISPVLRDGKAVYDLPPISFNAARDREPVMIRGDLETNWDSTVSVAVEAFKSKARADAVRDGIIEDARAGAEKYFKQYASDDVVYSVPSGDTLTKDVVEPPHMALALPKLIFDENGYEAITFGEEVMPYQDLRISKTDRNLDSNVQVGFYEKNSGRFAFPDEYSSYRERVKMTFHDPASPKDKRVIAFFEPDRYNIHAFVQIENNVYQFYSFGESENASRDSMKMLLLSAMTAGYKDNPKHDRYAEYVANCASYTDDMWNKKPAPAKRTLDKILAYSAGSRVSRVYNSVYRTICEGEYVSCDVAPFDDLLSLYHYAANNDHESITDDLIDRIDEHEYIKGTEVPSLIDDFIVRDMYGDDKLKNVPDHKRDIVDRLIQEGAVTYDLRKYLGWDDYGKLLHNALNKHGGQARTLIYHSNSHGLNVWYDGISFEKVYMEKGEEAIWNWYSETYDGVITTHDGVIPTPVFVISTPTVISTNYSVMLVYGEYIRIYDDPFGAWNKNTVNDVKLSELNFSGDTVLAGKDRKYTNRQLALFLRELKESAIETRRERVDITGDIGRCAVGIMYGWYGR